MIEPSVSPASRSPPELSRSAYEARSDPGGVRAQQRAEARERRLATTATWVLGGSFISLLPWPKGQGTRLPTC